MFGLRPENDTLALRALQPLSTRNSKFAETLHGRFNVVGVSGSLQKHTKEKTVSKTKKRIVDYRELYERHQEDLEKDAKRLQELQIRLAEVKHQKELRRRREESRQSRKRLYDSATIIQTNIKRWFYRHRQQAVIVVLAYLRSIQYKQAMIATSWACKILRRFIQRLTWLVRLRLRYRHRTRKTIQRIGDGIVDEIIRSSVMECVARNDMVNHRTTSKPAIVIDDNTESDTFFVTSQYGSGGNHSNHHETTYNHRRNTKTIHRLDILKLSNLVPGTNSHPHPHGNNSVHTTPRIGNTIASVVAVNKLKSQLSPKSRKSPKHVQFPISPPQGLIHIPPNMVKDPIPKQMTAPQMKRSRSLSNQPQNDNEMNSGNINSNSNSNSLKMMENNSTTGIRSKSNTPKNKTVMKTMNLMIENHPIRPNSALSSPTLTPTIIHDFDTVTIPIPVPISNFVRIENRETEIKEDKSETIGSIHANGDVRDLISEDSDDESTVNVNQMTEDMTDVNTHSDREEEGGEAVESSELDRTGNSIHSTPFLSHSNSHSNSSSDISLRPIAQLNNISDSSNNSSRQTITTNVKNMKNSKNILKPIQIDRKSIRKSDKRMEKGETVKIPSKPNLPKLNTIRTNQKPLISIINTGIEESNQPISNRHRNIINRTNSMKSNRIQSSIQSDLTLKKPVLPLQETNKTISDSNLNIYDTELDLNKKAKPLPPIVLSGPITDLSKAIGNPINRRNSIALITKDHTAITNTNSIQTNISKHRHTLHKIPSYESYGLLISEQALESIDHLLDKNPMIIADSTINPTPYIRSVVRRASETASYVKISTPIVIPTPTISNESIQSHDLPIHSIPSHPIPDHPIKANTQLKRIITNNNHNNTNNNNNNYPNNNNSNNLNPKRKEIHSIIPVDQRPLDWEVLEEDRKRKHMEALQAIKKRLQIRKERIKEERMKLKEAEDLKELQQAKLAKAAQELISKATTYSSKRHLLRSNSAHSNNIIKKSIHSDKNSSTSNSNIGNINNKTNTNINLKAENSGVQNGIVQKKVYQSSHSLTTLILDEQDMPLAENEGKNIDIQKEGEDDSITENLIEYSKIIQYPLISIPMHDNTIADDPYVIDPLYQSPKVLSPSKSSSPPKSALSSSSSSKNLLESSPNNNVRSSLTPIDTHLANHPQQNRGKDSIENDMVMMGSIGEAGASPKTYFQSYINFLNSNNNNNSSNKPKPKVNTKNIIKSMKNSTNKTVIKPITKIITNPIASEFIVKDYQTENTIESRSQKNKDSKENKRSKKKGKKNKLIKMTATEMLAQYAKERRQQKIQRSNSNKQQAIEDNEISLDMSSDLMTMLAKAKEKLNYTSTLSIRDPNTINPIDPNTGKTYIRLPINITSAIKSNSILTKPNISSSPHVKSSSPNKNKNEKSSDVINPLDITHPMNASNIPLSKSNKPIHTFDTEFLKWNNLKPVLPIQPRLPIRHLNPPNHTITVKTQSNDQIPSSIAVIDDDGDNDDGNKQDGSHSLSIEIDSNEIVNINPFSNRGGEENDNEEKILDKALDAVEDELNEECNILMERITERLRLAAQDHQDHDDHNNESETIDTTSMPLIHETKEINEINETGEEDTEEEMNESTEDIVAQMAKMLLNQWQQEDNSKHSRFESIANNDNDNDMETDEIDDTDNINEDNLSDDENDRFIEFNQ